MLISVIMPCYNYGAYVSDAIKSVTDQTYAHFELIVVNDGSTDDTKAVLDDENDPRLTVVHTENQGVSAARNTALDLAKGELIAFLDADDRWRPEKLQRFADLYKACPELGFMFSNFVRFDNQGNYLDDHFRYSPEFADLRVQSVQNVNALKILDDSLVALLTLTDMPWYPTASVVRADLAKSVKFDTGMRIGEDVYYFVRIWAKGKSAYFNESLAELRRHGENASSNLTDSSHHQRMIDIMTGLVSEITRPDQKTALLKRIGREHLNKAHVFWRAQHFGQSGRAYMKALRYPGTRGNALKHLLVLPGCAVWKLLLSKNKNQG